MSTTQERWPEVVWTPRERDVIDLVGRGCTNADIAEELGISFATAKWYVSEVITKLGASSREDVADYWRAQRGLAARWRKVRRALALLPLAKLGLGGTAATGLGVLTLVASGWLVAGETGEAGRANEQAAEPPAFREDAATPLPTPFPPGSGPWYVSQNSPAGCPTASNEGFEALRCDWRNYPEVVAITGTQTCDLSGATLDGANLYFADLRGCLLEGTVIRDSDATYADFSGTRAERLALENVNTSEASFRNADLAWARFDGSSVSNADFTRANLLGATFRAANVSDPLTTWRDTICPDGVNSNTRGGTCAGSGSVAGDHEPGPPTSVSAQCIDLANRALPCLDTLGPNGGCGWDINQRPSGPCSREHFPSLAQAGPGCSLRGADLSGLELPFVDLRGCDLTGADLSGSDLTRAALDGAILDGANLTETWLGLASLEDASLRGSTLDGALLMHAEIAGADFAGSTLGRVGGLPSRYNDTICPDGSNSDDDDGDGESCRGNMTLTPDPLSHDVGEGESVRDC